MSGRQARGGRTRERIIEAARGLFAARGYDQVSIATILDGSGFSKGALYHHFTSKEAVFAAVLESIEETIVQRMVAAAAPATSPAEALRLGASTWLRLAATDRAVRQVVLLDAPVALGWHAWRATEARYTLGLMTSVLAGSGIVEPGDEGGARVIAHVLMAMLIEAALLVAAAPGDEGVLRRAQATIFKAIDGVLAPG